MERHSGTVPAQYLAASHGNIRVRLDTLADTDVMQVSNLTITEILALGLNQRQQIYPKSQHWHFPRCQ
ncbi:MAG: hypothetical protein ACRC6S_11675 [Shewanella sp.]